MPASPKPSAALVVAALAAMGCGKVYQMCTDMGCQGTLTVTMETGPLDDGAYRAEIDDSATSFDLIDGTPATPDDAWLVVVDYDGTTLQVTVPTGMNEPAETVDVRLLDGDDAVILFEASGAPTWGEPVYPNGEDCDEWGCSSGTLAVP